MVKRNLGRRIAYDCNMGDSCVRAREALKMRFVHDEKVVMKKWNRKKNRESFLVKAKSRKSPKTSRNGPIKVCGPERE